jgi:arginase
LRHPSSLLPDLERKKPLVKGTKMAKPVKIIGAPMDLGQSRRGVDMGPGAIRYAGLYNRIEKLGYEIQDLGNIFITDREKLPNEGGLFYSQAITEACSLVYDAVKKSVEDNYLPIVLGGDHSVAIGSIGGITHHEKAGIIWVDAHGDFNIPATSPNGNIHGMPVAVLLGLGLEQLVNIGRPGPKLRAEDIVLIGVRDLDYDEKTMLKNSGIKIFTMRDIDEQGMGKIAEETLYVLKGHKRIHVSLDMDCLDPKEAPGVGTPAPGGLTYREAHLLMEIISDKRIVCSMDVVENNPILDNRNQTAILAVELIASLLGEKII